MITDAEHCAVRLRTAAMQLSRQLRAAMQRDGLSQAMLSALGQLYRGGAMTPTELARLEGVKLQSLTRLLADLEAAGWMTRQVNQADARQSVLSISPQGKKRLGVAVKGGERSLARVIQTHLSEADQSLLLRACTLLESVAEAMRDEGQPS